MTVVEEDDLATRRGGDGVWRCKCIYAHRMRVFRAGRVIGEGGSWDDRLIVVYLVRQV